MLRLPTQQISIFSRVKAPVLFTFSARIMYFHVHPKYFALLSYYELSVLHNVVDLKSSLILTGNFNITLYNKLTPPTCHIWYYSKMMMSQQFNLSTMGSITGIIQPVQFQFNVLLPKSNAQMQSSPNQNHSQLFMEIDKVAINLCVFAKGQEQSITLRKNIMLY